VSKEVITEYLSEPGIYWFCLLSTEAMAVLYFANQFNASFLICPGTNLNVEEGIVKKGLFRCLSMMLEKSN